MAYYTPYLTRCQVYFTVFYHFYGKHYHVAQPEAAKILADAGFLLYNGSEAAVAFCDRKLTGQKEALAMEEKQLEEIDIEGAVKIGEGAHSEVYRIADDTIVKVYQPSESLDRIRKEKELSRWAFVKGVPTAISFNVVRVGDRYGLVYEMLNACFAPDYIKKSEEHFEDFVRRSVDLMQQIHAIEVAPGELPDMKEQTREWIGKCRKYMESDVCDRLDGFLEEIPDSHTLLHADYHIKNIMVSDSELMLIDMDTLCMGDPIFELATVYNSYKEFPSVSPEAAVFLGIDVETADRLWERTVNL